MTIAGTTLLLLFLPLHAHSELQQAAIVPSPSENFAPLRSDIVPPGKDMSPPILIHSVEPRWPASIQRFTSTETVIVNCYVERDGTTSNVHAIRVTVSPDSSVNDSGPKSPRDNAIDALVAKSLKDNAVEAVKHYKFNPAKKDGKPVPVELNVNVLFRP